MATIRFLMVCNGVVFVLYAGLVNPSTIDTNSYEYMFVPELQINRQKEQTVALENP